MADHAIRACFLSDFIFLAILHTDRSMTHLFLCSLQHDCCKGYLIQTEQNTVEKSLAQKFWLELGNLPFSLTRWTSSPFCLKHSVLQTFCDSALQFDILHLQILTNNFKTNLGIPYFEPENGFQTAWVIFLYSFDFENLIQICICQQLFIIVLQYYFFFSIPALFQKILWQVFNISVSPFEILWIMPQNNIWPISIIPFFKKDAGKHEVSRICIN